MSFKSALSTEWVPDSVTQINSDSKQNTPKYKDNKQNITNMHTYTPKNAQTYSYFFIQSEIKNERSHIHCGLDFRNCRM